MKNKKIILCGFLTIIFLGSFLIIGNCYSPENSYNDSDSDATTPDTEIITVWVDNTESFIKFKVEMNQSWSFAPFYRIYVFISVDPLTGSDWGGFIDFNSDYVIDFNPSLTEDRVDFIAVNNISNNLNEGEELGMAFSTLTNNNKTIEFGWKLKTYYGGTGYLNLSFGQTIQIKFYAGGDSDYAPDMGLDPLNYTLERKTIPNIPGFNITFIITSSLTSAAVLIFIKKIRKK